MAQSTSVAFQGVAGANSEAAIRQHFGAQVTTLPVDAFDDIFRAVESGTATYGMLPVENSSAGSVARAYELLMDYDLRIQAEVILHIHYQLLAAPGTKLADIKRVQSHPQALAQCVLINSVMNPVRWTDWFALNELPLPTTGAGPSFDRGALAIAAAVQGLGLALESTRFAQEELAKGELVPVGGGRFRSVTRELHFLCYRVAQQQHPKIAAFRKWLLDAAATD